MKKDRNCNNFGVQPFPYQPMMPMNQVMPGPYNQGFQGTQGINERLDNIEKRLSIIEANLNNQQINSTYGNTNYQII